MPRKKKDYSPLPGYPIETQFQCLEEIEQYLSRNLIQCRECGHHFSALPRHLTRQHQISADEYRRKHGLPWSRGLVSGQFYSQLSAQAKEEGAVANIGGPRPAKGRKLNTREYCPARVNARRVYPRETYFRIADRVAAGEALLTICREDGMPTVSGVAHFKKKDREFAAYWQKVAAPFVLNWRTSVRKNLASGRVIRAINLADGGAHHSLIAKETGYSEANARLFLKRGNWKLLRRIQQGERA